MDSLYIWKYLINCQEENKKVSALGKHLRPREIQITDLRNPTENHFIFHDKMYYLSHRNSL